MVGKSADEYLVLAAVDWVVGAQSSAVGVTVGVVGVTVGITVGVAVSKSLVDLLAEPVGITVTSDAVGDSSCRGSGGGASLASGKRRRILDLFSHAFSVSDVLRTANTSRSHVMGLLFNLASGREVGRSGSGADAKDRGFPFVTLLCHVVVFGSLGRNTSWELDVWEDAVLLCDSHVNLGLGRNLISLLLALHELALSGRGVSLVNVLDFLRIVLCLLKCTVGLDLDLIKHRIELSELVLDDLLKNLLKSWAHDLEHERLSKAKQQLVLRLLELNVEMLHININALDLEEVLTILRVSSGHLDLEAEASAAEENVANTSVGD